MVDVFRNLLLVPEGDVVVEGDESENGDEEGDEKDKSIGTTAALQRNVLPTHKRSLSAYSEMPTQPHQKKISITEHLVARYAMCTNCEQEFDVIENFSEACIYHDGELEVNYDHERWYDWDEASYGRISEMEEEHPEGFTWSCCEEDGTAEGCQTDWHQKVMK